MDYSYPYRHPGLNYVYPQIQPGFAVHQSGPVAAGITATSNQSAQSVGISVNIDPTEGSPVSAKSVSRCGRCRSGPTLIKFNGHYLK